MNFGKAFTYIFEDKRWFEKLLTPLLVMLIPVVGGITVAGYLMRVMRNVSEHQIEPLPVLEFGSDLKRGFKWIVAALVYSIPIFLIYLVILVPLVVSADNGGPKGLAIVISLFAGLIVFLYGLALFFVLPAVNANVAMKESIAAAFDFKEIMRLLKNNLKAWLTILGGSLVCSLLIAPLGAIVLVVGGLITGLYSQLVVAHLTGQAYSLSQTPGGEGAQPF